jgi:hypothetical protein
MFWRFKNVLLRSILLSILYSSEYKVFEIDILRVCEIHHLLYVDLFSEFFET